MSLLDRALEKSRAPYSRDDLEEMFRLYGSGLKLLAWRNDKNELAGFALLTLPMRMLGKNMSTLLAVGSDGTPDAKKCFEEIKQTARDLGADTLMASTWRNPKTFVRRFGAEIDSVNLRWSLKEDGNAGPTVAQFGVGSAADDPGGQSGGTGDSGGEGTAILAGPTLQVPPRRHKQHRGQSRRTRIAG